MTKPESLNQPEPVAGHRTLPPNADPQLTGSLQAMRRAAQRARLTAQQTGTELIFLRNGEIVRVSPFDPALD